MICLALALAAILSCLAGRENWPLGVFCTVLTGLLQEPVRKVLPGQPPWIHAAFLLPVLYCLARLACLARLPCQTSANPNGRLIQVIRELNGLRTPLLLVSLTILTATLARLSSGFNWPNVQLVALGWLGPALLFAGCIIGLRLPAAAAHPAVPGDLPDERRVTTWARWMCAALTLFLCGHLLELNPDVYAANPAIGPLPPFRPWFRTIGDDQFRMFSGYFRSPDIAGWFAALQVACALLVSVATCPDSSRRRLRGRLITSFWLLAGAFGGFCCLISGRRKMQILLLICMALAGGILWCAAKKPTARRLWLHSLAIIVLACGLTSLVPKAGMYLNYFRTAPELAPARLVNETVTPIAGNLSEASLFGMGLGTMTPGCQHVGGSLPIFSEGGLARVFIEGGWFGLILFCIAVGMAFTACVKRTMSSIRQSAQPEWRAIGVAFLFGCLVSFLIGHQVYGDPLVLFVTGLIAGAVCQNVGPARNFER